MKIDCLDRRKAFTCKKTKDYQHKKKDKNFC